MIDSHCHLAGGDFAADLDGVVSRARAAGVSAALCIVAANDEQESAAAPRVLTLWPATRFATGIHPHQAGEFATSLDGVVELVRDHVTQHRACAVGEIGLDYHYDFSPRSVQQEIFRRQVELAKALQLPVVVHTREATDDTFDILRRAGQVRGVFHCFTGDEATARRALDLGFYVSFSGMITFPRAGEIRAAARSVPRDRLLAETDSPYLAPVPHRGTRNEPARVVHVVDALAEIRGELRVALDEQIDVNFEALFG